MLTSMYQFWSRQIWSSLTQIRSTSWNGDRYCIIIIIVIVIIIIIIIILFFFLNLWIKFCLIIIIIIIIIIIVIIIVIFTATILYYNVEIKWVTFWKLK